MNQRSGGHTPIGLEWFDPPFDVLRPDVLRAPVVFNSPHSGRIYPAEFVARSKLDPHALRRSEDYFVDQVFHDVVDLGMPLMRANFPRAYLDVNREPFELDPMMFTDPLPDYVNTGSVRVAGGLGTIARVVSETEEIYREPLTFAEAEARILSLHVPYHQQLARLLAEARETFGVVLLVDCHSMPSSVPAASTPDTISRPDIIIGDRYGSSCSCEIVDMVEHQLIGMGYSVSRNRPYAGGFITQTYGRPVQAMHALQLEINRALYIDESNLEKHAGFTRLRHDICTLVSNLVGALPGLLRTRQAAAE
jgi:N-formylglutamate amidohydrolase